MIQVGIIGLGGISRTHIETYRKFSNRCRIVALTDTDTEKAELKKNEGGFAADVYDDYRKLLSHPNIDLVSVCTPPYTHASITQDALDAGKHVLCEKPMASSLAECDAMLAAQARCGKILGIIAQNRYRNPTQKLKSILDSGRVGRILHSQVNSYWWRGHSYYDLWWRGTWAKEGGGCTLNHAVHHIDLFQWMMGMPEEVRAVMTNTAHDNAEVEDLSIAILRYAKGSLAQVTSSVVHHGEEQKIIFQTEKARISFPWKIYASLSRSNGFPDRNPKLENEIETLYQNLPDLPYELYEGEFDDMFTAIETGRPVLVDGVEGRKTLELITAIYQAASTDTTVKLPLDSSSPFYTAEGMQKHTTHFYAKGASVEKFCDDRIIVGSSTDQKSDES